MSNVQWRQVNGDQFEYAIQQGPHGDEFVKLLDGSCLCRPLLLGCQSAALDLLEALVAIVARDDNSELGLCDSDGGHPDEGGCSPYPSDKLRAALNKASAAIAKATGATS